MKKTTFFSFPFTSPRVSQTSENSLTGLASKKKSSRRYQPQTYRVSIFKFSPSFLWDKMKSGYFNTDNIKSTEMLLTFPRLIIEIMWYQSIIKEILWWVLVIFLSFALLYFGFGNRRLIYDLINLIQINYF